MLWRAGGNRLTSLLLVVGLSVIPLMAAQRGTSGRPVELHTIELKVPDGQILSYRPNAGPIEVRMRGTGRAAGSRIKLKVESRPGFMEIDINRGDIKGLKPARQYGRDYLTYVLWAVSVAGMASNLGEITFVGKRPISINVTTPYQTFWLMVTAEPDFAVTDPSSHVILYSVSQGGGREKPSKRALRVEGDMFFYTHYSGYDSRQATEEDAPNDLLQARKAVALASRAGILATGRRTGGPRVDEERRSRQTLEQAKTFMAMAEKAYEEKPRGKRVIQFARTAAQIAENARALAVGAVGGAFIHQLENDLSRVRAELARARAALPDEEDEEDDAEPPKEGNVAGGALGDSTIVTLASKPVVWFGFLGWGLALLLLFRRQTG